MEPGASGFCVYRARVYDRSYGVHPGQRLWLQSQVLWAGATEDMVLEPEAMVYEPESMTGVRGGARVYGVRARVYDRS